MEKQKEQGEKSIRFMRRGWGLPCLLAFFFSACIVFGAQLERQGSVSFTNPSTWLLLLLLTLVVAPLLRASWNLAGSRRRCFPPEQESPAEGNELRSFGIYALIIFLCYLPVLLAVYPGFFVYDAQDELMQVVTRSFSTHHPLLHVLLMGGTVQAGYKLTGDYNVGIAAYTVLQMLLLSGIFSWCICRLKREGMGKAGRIACILYFGWFPVIVMFVLCSAKDGLFSGMLLAVVMVLRRWQAEGVSVGKEWILFAVSSVLMMLLRHNGFYAFIVFGVLFCRGKRLLLSAGAALLALFLSSALSFAFQAEDSEHQEMLTVPIQQLARVYCMDGGSLTEEEKQILYEVLPEDALRRYSPKVSDGVKVFFDNEAFEKAPWRYGRLWLSLGLRHPFTYLNAWFMTSYGFWYPHAVVDVYRGNTVFTFTYGDSSYFGYEVEKPGVRHSLIPWLDKVYRSISLDVVWQKLPVLSLFLAPGGFVFWFMVYVLGFFIDTKRPGRAVPYLLPLLVWATVLLGPTYLVRYVVFWWFLLPVLCWDLINEGNCAILTKA